jgi:dTDP-L-rhamnose 4-epimerase
LKILVTGGAGFIGSHLVDALIEKGHTVRILDNLEPQVHGILRRKPAYLNEEAEFIKGDVCNRNILKKAIKDIEIVFHQAARVGVGQSMYELKKYIETNTQGTANLLDILINERHGVTKLIVASSMSIYGEGRYRCTRCGIVYPHLRTKKQIKMKSWEMACDMCGKRLKPIATAEDKPLLPTSIYAITKRDQEEMCLVIGRAYKIPTVALRYFNVYGPRQALSNPYTGVLAIFSSRILNNHPPLIFEDGLQSRDFIHVKDIAQANLLAMKKKEADYEVFNVATGNTRTIMDIAKLLIKKINPGLHIKLINKFRAGDIRHCYADIAKIKKTLGFSPQINFERGIQDLIYWLKSQKASDGTIRATCELRRRGLVK